VLIVIDFGLDHGSAVTTYPRLLHQREHAPRLGAPRPEDRPPTAKEVDHGGLQPGTVLEAYRAGLVGGWPGAGPFVRRSLGGASVAEHPRPRESLTGWARDARSAGLDAEACAHRWYRTLLVWGEDTA
jgi:hypothetical protein